MYSILIEAADVADKILRNDTEEEMEMKKKTAAILAVLIAAAAVTVGTASAEAVSVHSYSTHNYTALVLDHSKALMIYVLDDVVLNDNNVKFYKGAFVDNIASIQAY